ncbi:hypothetical protein FPQ18DRAFT_359642 [Pyronema domesticum]|nr:hypothetical protein FPQ18DRAFT_359642 [Pyronema domesticum]
MGFKRKTRTSAGTTAVAPAAVAISPVPAPVPVPTPAPSDPEPQPQVTTEQPQTVQPQPPLVPLAPLVIDARQFQASPETPNPDPDVEEPPLKIRRGGRQPGAQSFKDEDKMRAFTAMKETKPATGADWDRCAEAYNAVATIARRKARDGNFLRNYWASCIKAGLPTPAKAHIEKRMPWEIKEAQGVKWDIETEIHRRHETVIVGEIDTGLSGFHQQLLQQAIATGQPQPQPIPESPAPAPVVSPEAPMETPEASAPPPQVQVQVPVLPTRPVMPYIPQGIFIPPTPPAPSSPVVRVPVQPVQPPPATTVSAVPSTSSNYREVQLLQSTLARADSRIDKLEDRLDSREAEIRLIRSENENLRDTVRKLQARLILAEAGHGDQELLRIMR